MSDGRARSHWGTDAGEPRGGWVESDQRAVQPSFEEETVARMDFQAELRRWLAFLPPTERVALLRFALGLVSRSDAEDRALRRARNKLSERRANKVLRVRG